MKKSLIYMLISVGLAALSCQKPAGYDSPLGFISRKTVLGTSAGVTPVVVYSNTSWKVRPLDAAGWASVDRFEGEGISEVKFRYAANYGRSRSIRLEFTAGDAVDTVQMYQQAAIADENVILTFAEERFECSPASGEVVLPFSTNLIYDMDSLRVTCEAEWIGAPEFDETGLHLLLEQNAGDEREAVVVVSHTDADGSGLACRCSVIQNKAL